MTNEEQRKLQLAVEATRRMLHKPTLAELAQEEAEAEAERLAVHKAVSQHGRGQ